MYLHTGKVAYINATLEELSNSQASDFKRLDLQGRYVMDYISLVVKNGAPVEEANYNIIHGNVRARSKIIFDNTILIEFVYDVDLLLCP